MTQKVNFQLPRRGAWPPGPFPGAEPERITFNSTFNYGYYK